MPKLWDETIEAHRRAVRDATLDATAALAAEHGLRGVTMSRIADETGIGRATLYKYFPDVEAILQAWHEREVRGHLAQLEALRGQPGDAGERLRAVLDAYADIQHQLPRHEHAAARLHQAHHVAHAQQQLRQLLRDLVAEAATAGTARTDVSPDELAAFCEGALAAARELPSKAAVRRLVAVTVDGLRPSAPA